MKISEVKTYLVEGIKYNWTLVKIETDSGIHGWGEATNWPGSPLIEGACQYLGEYILGKDARQIDFLWTKLYKDFHWLGQAGPLLSAISAIDIALWDIQGKALGVPIYQLLGGKYRDRLQLYANYWFTGGGHSADDYARQAEVVAQKGFSALKFDPFAHINYLYGEDLAPDLSLDESQKKRALAVTRAVQDAVGPNVQLAIETHAMLNGPTAIKMAQRIETLGINCMWYEEPAPPETPDAIADIKQRTRLPIAVGERLHSRYMFRPVLEARAADILMPDVTRCGGISELRKIATLAETYNVPVAPHNPNGPICTIAAAHTVASVPNFFRLEFMLNDVPWRDECLSHPLPVENGYFVLPDRPGLGFDVNEDVLLKHPGLRQKRTGFYV
ncbi:MAG: mandelate racemase/muconate lactonizing enzyme family protein [Trueperaceae bacterium]|nr:mandelate racemase/muconate lactonizing enzyme family protein [Trueperaceae bacterium]